MISFNSIEQYRLGSVGKAIGDVTLEDIAKIITLCLRHRLRKDPLESIDSGDKVGKVFKEVFEIEN